MKIARSFGTVNAHSIPYKIKKTFNGSNKINKFK